LKRLEPLFMKTLRKNDISNSNLKTSNAYFIYKLFPQFDYYYAEAIDWRIEKFICKEVERHLYWPFESRTAIKDLKDFIYANIN
jgi:hypothetical protein